MTTIDDRRASSAEHDEAAERESGADDGAEQAADDERQGERQRESQSGAAVGGSGNLDASVVAEFERELADARRLADENHDKYLRAEADLDNMRRRGRRQTEEALKRQRRDLLERVLVIADNLELALAHSDADPDSVVQGVEGTYRDLARMFEQEGIAAIDALEAPFDPNLHEAVGVVPAPGAEDELVVSVERAGYTLDGETLRPARVLVGKPTDVGSHGAEPTDDDDTD